MNILIDTSIWIEFLKARPIYFEKVSNILENESVFGFEPIFAELLQGAKTNKERDTINNYYENLTKYNIDIKDIIIKAGYIAGINKWNSKGIGLIDSMIIIFAFETNSKIWTLDKKIKGLLIDENPKYLLEV